jgi:hypothetical protein
MTFKDDTAYKPPLAQDYEGEEDVENPAPEPQVPLVEVLEMSKRHHAIAVLSTFRFRSKLCSRSGFSLQSQSTFFY